jgi:hypothetical protein
MLFGPRKSSLKRLRANLLTEHGVTQQSPFKPFTVFSAKPYLTIFC